MMPHNGCNITHCGSLVNVYIFISSCAKEGKPCGYIAMHNYVFPVYCMHYTLERMICAKVFDVNPYHGSNGYHHIRCKLSFVILCSKCHNVFYVFIGRLLEMHVDYEMIKNT